MMKRLLVLSMCFWAYNAMAQNVGRISHKNPQTIIEGQLDGLGNDSTVRIMDMLSQSWDTTTLKNHRFKFELPMTFGGAVYIIQYGSVKKGDDPINKGLAVAFYLDSGKLTIKGNNFLDAKYAGSSWVKDWQEVYAMSCSSSESEFERSKKKYYEAVAIGDEDAKEALTSQMNQFLAKKQIEYKNWINAHSNSRVGGYLISLFFNNRKTEDSLFNALTAHGRESLIYRNWAEPSKWGVPLKLAVDSTGGQNIAGQPKIGTMARNIGGFDVNGTKVSLSDFKGKYVLIDFWASWCAPCRAAMPALKESYEKVKAKENFVLLSVSLDTKKEGWLKAIAKDGIPWLNISNLKGWGEPASAAFGIRAIPANVLIGPDGKIVAYNLFDEALDQKLKEVL